jgi:hypothetical protein
MVDDNCWIGIQQLDHDRETPFPLSILAKYQPGFNTDTISDLNNNQNKSATNR